MNPAAKLGAYGLILAAMVGAGAAVGSAAAPIDVGGAPTDRPDGHDSTDPTTGSMPAGGLLVSQDGYTLELERRVLEGGGLAFRITGPDGAPVVDFDEVHERKLHLIVAARDLSEFLHVHPAHDGDGRWTIDLPELPPGAYRAFADFQPAGADQYTLGIDLTVPGETEVPAPLAERTHDSVDGFEATLEGAVSAGSESVLTVTVRRQGEVVATEPYLGAAGHLVALRDGDLAYLHVHPLDHVPRGPVRFAVAVPSPGAYALFFDFLVDGEVHTARFAVTTSPDLTPSGQAPAHGADHGH